MQKSLKIQIFVPHLIFITSRSKAIRGQIEGVPDAHLSQSPVPNDVDQPPTHEIERHEKIKEKYKYLCVAFDGDHPQIVATERVLIPRSVAKNQDLVFVKWAGGCSMTQSPNDHNRGMHPVLKKVYGDSKFRYDAIADPHGGKWAKLKEYLKRFLDPASFRTVWKALCYAPAFLQNGCKASSIRSAYHNTGIIDQN